MAVQLSYGGVSWRLPKEWTLESIRDDIKNAMDDRSALSIDLGEGETLILNPHLLGHVVVLDDRGDPSKAPSSWDRGGMVSSGTGSAIRSYPESLIGSGRGSVISYDPGSVISYDPGSVISYDPGSVISYNPGSVISSGSGSITISWSAGPTGYRR